jgi:RNA polymerase sigma-70 factor (ECF subfamily)
MMTLSDTTLIELSQVDPEAFGEIFDRHFTAIYRFCARRVGPARGEDLAGDVFRWAFENRDRYDLSRSDARPWLFGIALNIVRDAMRSSGRESAAFGRSINQGIDLFGEVDAQVASALDAKTELAAVAVALERQPTADVETLLLYAWDELSYAEIAEALDVPVGTVRSRLNRIRERLHCALDEAAVERSTCSAVRLPRR